MSQTTGTLTESLLELMALLADELRLVPRGIAALQRQEYLVLGGYREDAMEIVGVEAVVRLVQRVARGHADEEEDIRSIPTQAIAGITIPLEELGEGEVVVLDISREAQTCCL